MLGRLLALGLGWLSVGCGDDGSPGGGGGGVGGSGAGVSNGGGEPGGGGAAGGAGGGESCPRDPGPADKERFVIVGHPYDDAVSADGSYEVLSLSAAGVLSTTGTRFHMGPPADRPISFTADGEIGFAVQDDGTLGVFRIDAAGQVTVLEEGLSGAFYAEAVRLDPSGAGVLVIDPNFPKNGGGVYPVALGCDESLTPGARRFESKSARDLFFDESSGDLLLPARGALGSTVVAHVHRLNAAGTELLASVDAFGDDDAITSWAALTRSKSHVIVADNSAFSGVPHRVAAVPVTANGLGSAQTLTGVDDPYSIAVSPFDDAVVVTSGFGDGIFVLDLDTSSASPLSLRGELPYDGASPQLPGALTMVERGVLDGLVLIADVRGVYAVQFGPNAEVDDLGVFDLGGGVENVVAGIGVQP